MAMAPTTADPTRKVPVLLQAIIIVILLATSAHGHGKALDSGCIRGVGDLKTPTPGSCLCYDKCAHKGGHEAGLTDAHAQTCFVECVLGDRRWDAVRPAAPLLSEAVRLVVKRPWVSRSRQEKEEMVELLVVELEFEPDTIDGYIPTDVYLNMPEGGEEKFMKNFVDTFIASRDEMVGKDRAVRKFPIGGKLEALGADGDETVVVSLVPYVLREWTHPYWYESHMVVVRSVRIVYEPKELYLYNEK